MIYIFQLFQKYYRPVFLETRDDAQVCVLTNRPGKSKKGQNGGEYYQNTRVPENLIFIQRKSNSTENSKTSLKIPAQRQKQKQFPVQLKQKCSLTTSGLHMTDLSTIPVLTTCTLSLLIKLLEPVDR